MTRRGVCSRLRQHAEGGHGLQACQRRPDAVVVAAAKAQMLVIAPIGIEAIRIGKPRRITTARRQHQHDGRTLGDGRPGDG